MKIRKSLLYLETSVWDFYFADDAPEKRDVTIEFFNAVSKSTFDIFLSDIVVNEIQRAPVESRERLIALINRFQPQRLPITEETVFLAKEYTNEGALPKKKFEDAMHAAIATVYEMDVLISWNLKHLANLRRMKMINGINLKFGYSKYLQLITPWEVSDDGL